MVKTPPIFDVFKLQLIGLKSALQYEHLLLKFNAVLIEIPIFMDLTLASMPIKLEI